MAPRPLPLPSAVFLGPANHGRWRAIGSVNGSRGGGWVRALAESGGRLCGESVTGNLHGTTTPAPCPSPVVLTMLFMVNAAGLAVRAGIVVLCRFLSGCDGAPPAPLPQRRLSGPRQSGKRASNRPATAAGDRASRSTRPLSRRRRATRKAPSNTHATAQMTSRIRDSVSCPSSDSAIETIPVPMTIAPEAGGISPRIRPSGSDARLGSISADRLGFARVVKLPLSGCLPSDPPTAVSPPTARVGRPRRDGGGGRFRSARRAQAPHTDRRRAPRRRDRRARRRHAASTSPAFRSSPRRVCRLAC